LLGRLSSGLLSILIAYQFPSPCQREPFVPNTDARPDLPSSTHFVPICPIYPIRWCEAWMTHRTPTGPAP